MGIFSPVSVCIYMAAVGRFVWVAEVDPKEANKYSPCYLAISWDMNDLWAPSSKRMFPSKLMPVELPIMAIAVFSKHELVCVVDCITLDFGIAGVSVTVVFLASFASVLVGSVFSGLVDWVESVHRLVWCFRLQCLHLNFETPCDVLSS